MKINQQSIEACKVIAVIQIIVGIGAFVLGFVYVTSGSIRAGLGILQLFVGVLLFKWGWKRRQMVTKAYEYESIIKDTDYISLAEIASQMKEEESTVLSNFEWMMIKDFWVDTRIDYNKKCVVLNDPYQIHVKQGKKSEQAEKERQQYREQQKQMVSEICDCCGGTTMIVVGQGGVCDYCRAPIGKYKKYRKGKKD